MKNPNLSKLIILGIISTGIALAGLPLIIQSFSKFYMKFICIGGSNIGSGYYIWNNICQMSLLRKSFVH